jgi:hypothetical protein
MLLAMETTRDVSADASFGYQAPTLTMHGTVAEVTGAQAVGTVTDKSFPAGTPVQDLTFS